MLVAVRVLVLGLLGTIAGACASQVTDNASKACKTEKRWELGASVLGCTPRCVRDQGADVDVTRRQPGEVEEGEADEVEVVVHLMMAEIVDPIRQKSNAANRWKLAPVARAVAKTVPDILPNKPPVEYWTSNNLWVFFGRYGEVNKIWKKHRIRLVLFDVEDCDYRPELLRLDGQQFDSIFVPQTRTPWARHLFRSINRLFTAPAPHRLHVFLWWSVSEDELGRRIPISGYSRAAARGGPAVWADAYKCLTPLTSGYHAECAWLLAHEVGHALGLQHVDGPIDNLMHSEYNKEGLGLTEWQGQEARKEARRQFGRQ